MKKAYAERWVKALRSGNYKQGYTFAQIADIIEKHWRYL